ncbi:MAG TPA: lamin tail domain-containing protein [Anaerolineales bacterium]
MSFSRNIHPSEPSGLRRTPVVVLVLAALGMLAGLIQPAAAKPALPAPASMTATSTFALSPTGTGTATSTATITNTPVPRRSVVINEVAWMGTLLNNPNAEWIELFNPGSQEVVLDGWTLSTPNNPVYVSLTGKIGPGGYFLLERDNDSTTIIDIQADQVYLAPPLADTAGSLRLLGPSGEEVDTANKNGGMWPAGDNFNAKCSMERAGKLGLPLPDAPGNWLTYAGQTVYGHALGGYNICGSPRHENWAYSVTPTPSRIPTRTKTPYPPYYTPTRTPTPKHSLTPTPNPFAPKPVFVYLNEFLAQPRSDWNGDSQINSGDEYIEIINLGSQAVSLNGWSLDDQPGDSSAYSIKNISIAPKARLVFFGAETGILLGNGGDSVRLIKPNGQIADAFTYGVIQVPDQTWCRLPDGSNTWVFGCTPTINATNRKAQNVIVGNRLEAAICISRSLPPDVRLAECEAGGLAAWDPALWQSQPDFPRFFEAGDDTYILD